MSKEKDRVVKGSDEDIGDDVLAGSSRPKDTRRDDKISDHGISMPSSSKGDVNTDSHGTRSSSVIHVNTGMTRECVWDSDDETTDSVVLYFEGHHGRVNIPCYVFDNQSRFEQSMRRHIPRWRKDSNLLKACSISVNGTIQHDEEMNFMHVSEIEGELEMFEHGGYVFVENVSSSPFYYLNIASLTRSKANIAACVVAGLIIRSS